MKTNALTENQVTKLARAVDAVCSSWLDSAAVWDADGNRMFPMKRIRAGEVTVSARYRPTHGQADEMLAHAAEAAVEEAIAKALPSVWEAEAHGEDQDTEGRRGTTWTIRRAQSLSSAAATLGRKGGSSKSPAKRRTAQENGKRGGRPRTSRKLAREHIEKEWSEAGLDDGYWVSLKRGWCWAGDPLGSVHCIHEPTRKAAMRERVRKCNCQDCTDGSTKSRDQT